VEEGGGGWRNGRKEVSGFVFIFQFLFFSFFFLSPDGKKKIVVLAFLGDGWEYETG
jgi:hypothetical protein